MPHLVVLVRTWAPSERGRPVGSPERLDRALEAGWPIASCIVEGAARHLVADRLDITGSRWSVPGAEAVLTLRTLISNGDFPQYSTFHTHRERERLCPRPGQHDYELPA